MLSGLQNIFKNCTRSVLCGRLSITGLKLRGCCRGKQGHWRQRSTRHEDWRAPMITCPTPGHGHMAGGGEGIVTVFLGLFMALDVSNHVLSRELHDGRGGGRLCLQKLHKQLWEWLKKVNRSLSSTLLGTFNHGDKYSWNLEHVFQNCKSYKYASKLEVPITVSLCLLYILNPCISWGFFLALTINFQVKIKYAQIKTSM